MRSGKLAIGTVALALAAMCLPRPAVAAEPTVWLNVEVDDSFDSGAKVKVHVPLSLIEVVIESVDTTEIMRELKAEKGLDFAKLWRHLREAEMDEFIVVESEEADVRVFKDRDNFRVTVRHEGHSRPNVKVRIPFAVMDYLFHDDLREFRLSDLVDAMRGHLPLVIVEAEHEEKFVKVWLEEK